MASTKKAASLEDEFDVTLTGLKNNEEPRKNTGRQSRVTFECLPPFTNAHRGVQRTLQACAPAPLPQSYRRWRGSTALCLEMVNFAVANTDLLPEGHPMKPKKEVMTRRAPYSNVEETDDAYHHLRQSDDRDRERRGQRNGRAPLSRRRRTHDRADLAMRAHEMDEKAIDTDTRNARRRFVEEPVKRFGMEVIDHSRESMNLIFEFWSGTVVDHDRPDCRSIRRT